MLNAQLENRTYDRCRPVTLATLLEVIREVGVKAYGVGTQRIDIERRGAVGNDRIGTLETCPTGGFQFVPHHGDEPVVIGSLDQFRKLIG